MSRRRRTALRLALLTVVLVSAVTVGHSFATTTGVAVASDDATMSDDGTATTNSSTSTGAQPRMTVDVESRFDAASEGTTGAENWSTERVQSAVDQSGQNLTVVATQGFYVSDERAELAAFLRNGTVVYYDNSYRVYFDVDPVPGTQYAGEYVAAEHLSEEACDAVDGETCTRNVVERVNLTTGDTERVYSEVTPRVYSARWHDVDRLNETHLLVADIVQDGVYAVDTRDGSVAWRWDASAHYNESQGGQDGDWTHINDVEALEDGSVMVSPRNMDEVIFIEPGPDGWAVNESRTLGEDDNHDILYEQHNPDYIPAERGGPSVVVADSENGRAVEYAQTDDGWEQTWDWRDVRLQWPRDADRLPNGNTLLVDTHGDRLAEVGPRDQVVWAADVGMPYDVERLGTGDESAGGPAAPYRLPVSERPGNASTVVDSVQGERAGTNAARGTLVDRPLVDQFWLTLKDAVPSLVANGLLYVSPSWVRFSDLAFAAVGLSAGLVWTGVEFYWSRFSIRGFAGRIRSRAARLR